MTDALLIVDGAVRHPTSYSFTQLRGLPAAERVEDVGMLVAKRRGGAVRLSALLERAGVDASATHVTLHASRDDFAASVPLDQVRDSAMLVFELDGGPLPVAQGGPTRFLLQDAVACRTGELDTCANVKFVDRIELTAGRGRDMRPATKGLHRKRDDRGDGAE